jgi:hypothetical protein
MGRFEVRGDHPATHTTGTSGRVALEDVASEAEALRLTGHVDLVVVDHDTGAEVAFENFEKGSPSQA